MHTKANAKRLMFQFNEEKKFYVFTKYGIHWIYIYQFHGNGHLFIPYRSDILKPFIWFMREQEFFIVIKPIISLHRNLNTNYNIRKTSFDREPRRFYLLSPLTTVCIGGHRGPRDEC